MHRLCLCMCAMLVKQTCLSSHVAFGKRHTNLWLRVALIVERKVGTKNRAKSGRHGVKRRDLEKELPQPKVEALCARLRASGLWQWDEDWPQDEEDCKDVIT